LAAFPGMAASARGVNLGNPERMTKLASGWKADSARVI
jgi:hypothetical protein